MNRFAVRGGGHGWWWQSAVPTIDSDDSGPTRAWGLQLRGVVLAIYVYDSAADPDSAAGGHVRGPRRAVYCDVMIYSDIRNMHGAVIPRALVSQQRGGIHEDEVWLPRPASREIGGQLDPDGAINPANLDGDHVLIGFIDDDLTKPVILRGIPHPNADIGLPDRPVTGTDTLKGHRLRAVEAESAPAFRKHRGVVWGVDRDGNWSLDLTRAHDGALKSDGAERPGKDRPAAERLVAGKAKHGNFKVKLPRDATIVLELDSGRKIELTDNDGKLTLKADKVHLNAGTVDLGDTATVEKVVLGTAWGAARATLDAALFTQLTVLATAAGGLSVSLEPAVKTFGAAASTAFTALATAITAFEGVSTGDPTKYLSGSVKTK